MREILSLVDRWQAEGRSIALATVVQTWRSSPRRAGAKMAVTSDGQVAGSVSGGCVENAVIEAAQDVITTGRARLLHFGVADETAWDVGLACGGSIDVFVQQLDGGFFEILRSVWMDDASSAVHMTVIQGSPDVLGRELLIGEDQSAMGTIGDDSGADIYQLASQVFQSRRSQRAMIDQQTELFMEFISPAPMLVMVGGVHITLALASLAKTVGFQTVVIDPRRVWGSEQRFPDVDRLIQVWPQEAFEQIRLNSSMAVVMLTHDPKLDDPALKIALRSPAYYVGALGSKMTHAKRKERLLHDGLTQEQLARLHAPIGLDIGAETPEEIALAILSEVVEAYRRQGQTEIQKEMDALSSP